MQCPPLVRFLSVFLTLACAPTHLTGAAQFSQITSNVFAWRDTCNVYIVRDGDAAILIDLGDGSVLERLPEIGVHQIDWILFTHHHREQCQGFARLKPGSTKIAAPEEERPLFERPQDFRKMKVSLGDAFTVYGSSFVRPPIQPIRLDRSFRGMDKFRWRGREFWCADTRGNSPGGMSYLLKENGKWLAFSGDVMLDGAKMHTWFDSEWDYGFAAGIYALHNSAALLEGFAPAWLLPSHGPPVRAPQKMLRQYQGKLRSLAKLLVRGYDFDRFAGADQDRTSKPSVVPWVWEVSPHLYKFKGPNYWPNLALILADNGHALAVDCGLFDESFLDEALALMKERMGLKQIDAVVITHMHGDHMLEAPHLREKWGAQIWALDRMGPVCEHPERFDYSAPVQAYDKGLTGVRCDRLFSPGESFAWQEFQFTIDWMPGQTEFALCLHGDIDGRKVAFTGDNIFGDPADPRQTGHEAMVAHNSAILEEGYIYGAELLKRLKPDLLMGGHSWVMDRPAKFIERYRRWAYSMRDAFQELSPDREYRYRFDPFWVRAEPYRTSIAPGQSTQLLVHVRNFRKAAQQHRIEIHVPAGLTVDPPVLEGSVDPETRGEFSVRVQAAASASPGVKVIAFDVTADGQRYGEWFDCIVETTK